MYSVYVNGTKVWSGGTFSNISGNGYHKFKNSTARIYHNDDGSKSFSASISGWFYSYGDKSGSKNFSLPTIPRVSDIEIDIDTVLADGTSQVIATATKKADAFTDMLTVSLGDYSKEIESGVAFTIPEEWNNAIPGTSAVATVKVETFSDTTSIGSKVADLTITVPETVVPVINDLDIFEAVVAVTNAFGNRFVQNLSQLNVEVDASGAYGSTIRSYSSSLDGVNYIQQAFTSNVIKTAGTLEIKVKVTDSRGRTAEDTFSVDVVEYIKPTITSMVYMHCDSDGTQNSSGECTKVTIAGKVYPVDGQNTKALKLKYKSTAEEVYTERVVTLSDWTFSVDVIINDTDPTVTYEYIAELTDKINAASPETFRVTTGIVVLSRLAGGGGLALFGEATEEGFVVGGGKPTILNDLTVQGVANIAVDEEFQTVWESTFGSAISVLTSIKDRLKDIAYKLGLIADYVVEEDTSGIWTYRKWNSGIAECWGRFQSGSISVSITWGSLKYNSIPAMDFPLTFVDIPNVNVTLENSNLWAVCAPQTESKLGTIYLVTAASVTVTTVADIQVKGRWK